MAATCIITCICSDAIVLPLTQLLHVLLHIVFCMGASNVPPICICRKSTLFGSRDQYSTCTWGSHMTNIKHFWNCVMITAHFSSHMTLHRTNTATVLHFVFIGTTPSAAFVNVSGLVGDAKRLLPHTQGTEFDCGG